MDNDNKKENMEVLEAIIEEIRQNEKQALVIIADKDAEANNAMMGMYGNSTLIFNALAGISHQYPEAFKQFLTLYMSKQLVDYLKGDTETQEDSESIVHTDDFDFSTRS